MRKLLIAVSATVIAPASPALANATYSGSVSAQFQDPVKSGNVILIDGTAGFLDNSATAAIFFTPDNLTLTWGNSTTGANPGFSYLFFTPASYSNVAPNTPFKLGTLQYLNGTSDLNTLIFGGTLHIDLGNGIDPKDIHFGISTTQNTGRSAARDADFITFGSDLPLSFNVYEGGFSIGDLYGQIVGDPQIQLTNFVLNPDFANGGFVGHGLGGVPEPANWALMIAGFGFVGGALRTRPRVSLSFRPSRV